MKFTEQFKDEAAFKAEVLDKWPHITLGYEWTTGGLTGGSCWGHWGHDAEWPVDPDPEPEIEELDEILQAYIPDLTFLEYRRLMKHDFIIREDGSRNEYYGNYTNWSKKTLDIGKLYHALVDLLSTR